MIENPKFSIFHEKNFIIQHKNLRYSWKNKCGKDHSEHTVTSGLKGAWTQAPTRWTTLYLQNLLKL